MGERKTYLIKKKDVSYQEIFADSDIFEKFYEIDNRKHRDMIALPDGRVDIQCLWRGNEMAVYICGSVLEGRPSRISGYDRCFGARFKLCVLPEEFRTKMDLVMNNRIQVENIKSLAPVAHIRKDLFLEQKADIMLNIFERGTADENMDAIRYMVDEIEKKKGNIVIDELVKTTGYSHRNMNYVFKNLLGCSIKKYASIIRQQASLEFLLGSNSDAIYDELGYYDQAHFIKDFKKFSQNTPNYILKNQSKIELV